ncbi:MAG: hypothetical protein RLZZ528_2521 [Pseudomonadota bacterium]
MTGPDAAYAGLPRKRLRPASLGWLIGLIAAAALGLNWLGGPVGRTGLPRHATYPGTIRPALTPTPVVLPAGIPLDRVLVGRGDTVVPGQTLATYDLAEIAARRDALASDILAARLLRDCLSGLDVADPALLDRSGIDPDTRHRLRAAVSACRRETLASARAAETHARARADLLDQQALQDRWLRLALLSALRDPGSRADRAGLALSAAAAQLRLRMALHRIDHDRDRRLAAEGVALAGRIAALDDTIRQARTQLDRLRRAEAAPRLRAPHAGTVLRVRRLPEGSSADDPVGLLDIRAGGDPGFQATVDLPAEVAATLEPEAAVRFRVLGLGGSLPPLSGHVAQLAAASVEGKLTATIALDAASAAYLADPARGIAFRGEDTLSALDLTLAEVPMPRAALASLRRAFPCTLSPGRACPHAPSLATAAEAAEMPRPLPDAAPGLGIAPH